jgi:hypothetical protein
VLQIENRKKLLDEFNYDKPIWITETGYSTGPISFCPIRQYPEYIVKTLSGLAVRAGRVRNLIWYELMDEYNPGEVKKPWNPLNYFGLVYPNKTYKPGTEAFMLTAGYLAGSEYRPELPFRDGVSKGTTALYFIRPDGTSILILWRTVAEKQKVRLTVPGTEDLSRHSIHNREIVSLSAEPVFELDKEPVFITWKGGGPPRLEKVK